jgi:transcriptional regulator with XRE-family HTH domain
MTWHERTPGPHPIALQIRKLRKAAGLSLQKIEETRGIPADVIGSYERGDREPSAYKLDTILRLFGYELRAVPIGATVVEGPVPAATVLTGEQIADALRSLADHLAPQDGAR